MATRIELSDRTEIGPQCRIGVSRFGVSALHRERLLSERAGEFGALLRAESA